MLLMDDLYYCNNVLSNFGEESFLSCVIIGKVFARFREFAFMNAPINSSLK